MPERQIDTFLTEVDKPDKPEEQPEDIAQPELDLAPLTGLDVSIAKPKANFKAGGSFFRDGEYIPLFKVVPIYPRRAQERGTMGYALVEFTITDTGSVEDAKAIEGYCSNSDPNDPDTEFRPCTMFNSASARAALKLKYKPKIVDGKAVPVEGVLHRFTYVLDDAQIMKKDLQKYFIAFISIFFIAFTFNIEAQNQSSDREVKKTNIKYKKARALQAGTAKKMLSLIHISEPTRR